jgi:hypothetical protein
VQRILDEAGEDGGMLPLLNELRQRTADLTERTDDLTESLEQQTATAEVLQVVNAGIRQAILQLRPGGLFLPPNSLVSADIESSADCGSAGFGRSAFLRSSAPRSHGACSALLEPCNSGAPEYPTSYAHK